MQSLYKRNGSRLAAAAVCLGIFLLMLFCNFQTNLVADDYRYFFSFSDGSRITRLSDIFPSMAAHRVTMNGRLVPHFLVQLFLLLPLPLFKLLNAAFFTALVWLIHTLACRGRKPRVLLLLSLFGALWVFQPDFGQVFLWLDGSVNYLWCAVLCLLWLLPWCSHFLCGRDIAGRAVPLYCLFSLLLGAYSENSTVALVFMALLFLLLRKVFRREALFSASALWQPLSLAFLLLGFFFLIFTPGELGNKSAGFALSVLFSNFLETARMYFRFWPLLLAFALLYLLACRHGVGKDVRLLSLVFFGGSLAGHFVLTFALYCAGRSTYIALILLLVSCALLFYELFESPCKPLLCALCAVCLGFTLYWGYVGIRDIRQTHADLSFNEQLICEAAANGETAVQLPRFYAATKYSALAGLPYLDTEDVTAWENVAMAKYYGVETVIGY